MTVTDRGKTLITVVLSLERTVAWGERLAYVTGLFAGAGGLVVTAISIL